MCIYFAIIKNAKNTNIAWCEIKIAYKGNYVKANIDSSFIINATKQ